jgi:MFS family permease
MVPTLISPFIGGILYETLGIDAGMRIGFTLAFIAGISVAFIRFRFLKETIDQPSEQFQLGNVVSILKKSYSSMFSILTEFKELRGLVILSIVDTLFGAIAAPFWVVYAKNVTGLTTLEWGIIQSLGAVINVSFLLFSGNFVDRFGKRKVILVNLLLAPIVNLSFVFCQNFYQVLVFQFLLTVQNAFIMPAAMALQADIVPRESRGRALAALGWRPVVIALGVMSQGFFKFPPYFVGSLLSGYVYERNPSFPWFILAFAYSLELIICFFLIKEPKKPVE